METSPECRTTAAVAWEVVDGGRRAATDGERRGEVGIRVRVSELRGEGGVAGERLRAWAE